MDRVNRNDPANGNGQVPPAEDSVEGTRPLPEEHVDAVVESDPEDGFGVDDGAAHDGPEPADASPLSGGPTVPADTEAPWPLEEISEEVDDIAMKTSMEGSLEVPEVVDQPAAESPKLGTKMGASSDEEAAKREEQPADVDPKAALAALEAQRDRLIAELFDKERPRQALAEKVIQAYVAALDHAEAGGVADPDEHARLVALVGERQGSAFAAEQAVFDEARKEAERHIAVYDKLFVELKTLVEDAASELAGLDEDDERFKQSRAELQDTLLNFKKGVAIIHRIFDRSMARKKELQAELPTSLADEWNPESRLGAKGTADFVTGLHQDFHKLRDASYHANQNARRFADGCEKTVMSTVSGLLSAVDGIDAGLQNEPETRSGWASAVDKQDDCSKMLESWLQAYRHLDAAVNRFFDATGIAAHTVDRGTPFDPETMEPQGTVADPNLTDEDVAAVMRRGFSLNGALIRPILVDVVRNS